MQAQARKQALLQPLELGLELELELELGLGLERHQLLQQEHLQLREA